MTDWLRHDALWDIYAWAYEEVSERHLALYFAATLSEYSLPDVLRAWRAWVDLTEHVAMMPEVPDPPWVERLDALQHWYSWAADQVINN